MVTISVAEARRLLPEMVADIEAQAGYVIDDDAEVVVDIHQELRDPYGFTEVARTTGTDALRDRELFDQMVERIAEARRRGVVVVRDERRPAPAAPQRVRGVWQRAPELVILWGVWLLTMIVQVANYRAGSPISPWLPTGLMLVVALLCGFCGVRIRRRLGRRREMRWRDERSARNR